MRHIIILIAFLCSLQSFADERSGQILGAISKKFNSYSAYTIDFKATVKGQGSVNGTLTVSGHRFALVATGMEVYYDGKAIWNYSKSKNQVDVQWLDESDPNVMMNPSKLLSINALDFNHQLLNPTTIELRPKVDNDNYMVINVIFDSSTNTPKSIVISGSNEMLEITLGKLTPNVAVSSQTFTFDTSRKGVEVVDFR